MLHDDAMTTLSDELANTMEAMPIRFVVADFLHDVVYWNTPKCDSERVVW
jgi:hypothetical protein